MYRDGAIDLDEHDRAVGLICIGETLFGQCEAALGKLSAVFPQERWRALRDLHDDYEQAWRHFDRAQKVLTRRGANTAAYDELRSGVSPTLVATSFGKKGEASHQVDDGALEDARRAIAELKLAIPGADWKGIATRTERLADQPQIRRPWFVYAFAAVLAFAVGVVAWSRVVTPGHKVDDRAVMRAEIRSVAKQRDMRIDFISPIATKVCHAPTARAYVKLLAMDGQTDGARAFGTRFIGQCGVDLEVLKWVTAPRPTSGKRYVRTES